MPAASQKQRDRPGIRYLALATVVTVCALAALVRPPFAPLSEPHPRALTSQAVVSRLEQHIGSRLHWIGAPGAAAAIVQNGQLTEWHVGTTRAWGGAPIEAHTQFEAASLSKPITAYAVMRLVRRGQLELDAPILRGGRVFTLRQVLSHSAGFDNDLTAAVEPRGAPGNFKYAGAGYLFLGDVIEKASGQSFADHMNTVVLPELGMTQSQFGVRAAADLALPTIDIGLPFAAMMLIATLVGAPLIGAHTMLARALSWHAGAWRLPRAAIAAIALGCGVFALYWLAGMRNFASLALPSVVLLMLATSAWVLAARPAAVARLGAMLCAAAFAGFLFVRPAAPLAERPPLFLPAAGLRSTATDYAKFLSHVIAQARTVSDTAQMLTPQTRANEDHDWGLGIGLQRGETPSVWHWGINFPGYQALAVANRETGDVAVILLNGGLMSFSPSGQRHAGLEAARAAIAEIEGGRHSSYWQDIP